MKLIQKMADFIEDEVEGAECYIKTAIKYKGKYPALAETFYTLALEEKSIWKFYTKK